MRTAIVALSACSASEAPTVESTYAIGWIEHRIDDSELSGIPLQGSDGLAMADLDSDGFDDVVSVHEDSSHVRIAFGGADPDTWENVTLASGENVESCEDVAIGDIDGDGRLDVVIAAEWGAIIWFHAPTDPRNPEDWVSTVLESTLDRGSWIRVSIADVDDDGRLDLVATNKVSADEEGTFSLLYLGR